MLFLLIDSLVCYFTIILGFEDEAYVSSDDENDEKNEDVAMTS